MVRWLIQLSPLRPNAPLALALATFHTALLVLLGVLLLYRASELREALDGLNTLIGLLLFAYLWSINWITTAGALRSFSSLTAPPWWEVSRAGLIWGGATGVASLAIPVVLFIPATLLWALLTLSTAPLTEIYGVSILGAFGAGPSFIVGAAIGFAFAALDYLLLRLANLASTSPAPAPSTNGTSDI